MKKDAAGQLEKRNPEVVSENNDVRDSRRMNSQTGPSSQPGLDSHT